MERLLLLVVASLVCMVTGDVFLHNPRGSNGRLNEANTNRNNANRLFDSQNNAKGGYCVGPAMSYYEGSKLDIEWAGSHACGSPKVFCQYVIQYMCSYNSAPPEERIRDGTTTNTIPNDPTGPFEVDGNGDLLYGLHESYDYYQDCSVRRRNFNLFIADRETEGNLDSGRLSAVFTRQNNNGNRHAYECPEERDYWPYWHPSPWKDVAVLTDRPEDCQFYQEESQNVKGKGYCSNNPSVNNPTDCGAGWQEQPAWGIAPPACVVNEESRDNHLGTTTNSRRQAHFRWTLPTSTQEPCIGTNRCNCVLRLRYNASSADLGPTGANVHGDFIDYTSNGINSPITDDMIVSQDGSPHWLAMDTTQFGRTWQDRSHVFHIRPRDSTAPLGNNIYNLNVQGKRGNIVQAYPALEYEFVPNRLTVQVGEFIHFQWTGCDTNPAGNAGEGTDQTDRSNIVQIETLAHNYPADDAWLASAANPKLFSTQALRIKMAMLQQTDCLTFAELSAKNGGNQNSIEQDVQNCMKLNAASQYFDGGLVQMNTLGSFYYMSTRNNNFSNRGQKGTIIVSADPVTEQPTSPGSEFYTATATATDDPNSSSTLAIGYFVTVAMMLVAFVF